MSRFDLEPPPAATDCDAPHFVVGQDDHGCWLAVETHNLGGGLFKSRQDALHYADFETGHRPGAIEMSPGLLQLRF